MINTMSLLKRRHALYTPYIVRFHNVSAANCRYYMSLPLANGKVKSVRVSTYIVEQRIGRKLKRNEVVHHKDFDYLNDDPSNLRLMTKSSHIQLHN